MYEKLEKINSRPEPFQFYTAEELWADPCTSKKMLEFHLNEAIDVSSRKMEFIRRSVSWMADRFSIGQNTGIVDFGCGPGLYATLLAEKNATVAGIDFSERSIRHARETAAQKGLCIEYVCADYLRYETDEKYDLATMIMCDFCALSPSQRKTMLEKFSRTLRPGGAVLLDVYSLAAFEQIEEKAIYETGLLGGFWSPDKYYGFLNTFKYFDEKVVLDKYTIVEKARTRTIYNWLQYFDRKSLAREFEQNGFKVEGFYSDVAVAYFSEDSPEFAVVARK